MPKPKTAPAKKKTAAANYSITISRCTADLINPGHPDPGLGYSDAYQLRDSGDNTPAGRGLKRNKGDIFTWVSDEPFTFVAADSKHWDGSGVTWSPLILGGYDFFAVNSTDPSTTNRKYHLKLTGNHGDAPNDWAGYLIMIPQLSLGQLHAIKSPQGQAGSDNPIVRATIILQ